METHSQIKKVCQRCGARLSAGNLARHWDTKKCMEKNQNTSEVSEQHESSETHKIHAEIHLVTLNDGSVILVQNQIQFRQNSLVLVAASDNSNDVVV